MCSKEANEDYVKIRFVDSQKHDIPYFSSHFENITNDSDKLTIRTYLNQFAWDELLPYQDIGGGIMPSRKDRATHFVDSINIDFEKERITASKKRYMKAGLPEPKRIYVWYFPNGQIHMMTIDEVGRLPRGTVNVVDIPGDLGTGTWKELGDFLFDAAYFWRVDRGSKSALIKRCDALIDARKKAGDVAWAGNLVFVREHWLGGNPRAGLFARTPSLQTPELNQELPWQNAGREFGREGTAYNSYPLKPYFGFKKVLEVNPRDARAIFWIKMLPWVNGFSLANCKTGQTTSDYIHECKRIYGNYREQLDDYHRFWYLKEFLRTSNGMTYEARWWLKKKGVSHDADLQWATDELASMFTRYPFLRYQIEEMGEWLRYMRNPNQVEPGNSIDGK